ncbi:MAG: FecR domain-containing protein [Bacteroidia bacterium]|nr:FecR domain-containing protein [Bacteroidia bacterium]
MENDIYDILLKHFKQETTAEEEKQLDKFRQENSFEYEQMRKLWFSDSEIKLYDFDTDAAWENVKKKALSQQGKRQLLFSRKWFAAAAVILLLFLGYWVLKDSIQSPQSRMISHKAEEGEGVDLIVLEDSTKIWLNEGAVLRYPQKFNEHERRISLSGEAFFEVEKDLNRPFIIQTALSETRVLGTSFNIKSRDEFCLVSVTEGRVEVSNSSDQKAILIAGEVARLQGKELDTYANANPNYLSWKTGVFHFEESTLRQMVEDLNSFYRNQILWEGSTEYNCNITADFENQSLEDIISMIELSCELDIKMEDGTYLIP